MEKTPIPPIISVIVGQLNAPHGAVVNPELVAQALQEGSLERVAAPEWVRELISRMFVELPPDTIGRATLAVGSTLEMAWALYEHSREEYGLPRVAGWENAVKDAL